MKKRNILGLIAVLVMTAGMITACDKMIDDVLTETDTSEERDTPEETGIPEENVTSAESDTDVEDSETTGASQEETDKTEDGDEAEILGFTVYDRDQNETRLAEYVRGNKVTMLNFWGTFCGPCINEMPDLADIERKYKDKGFEIVGVTTDAMDYYNGSLMPDIMADADEIIKQTNVEYPVVYAGPELIEYTNITAVPTTFFVDRKGNLLSAPAVGSRSMEDWEDIITELLENVSGN